MGYTLKKMSAVFLSLMMILSLAACGNSKAGSEAEVSTQPNRESSAEGTLESSSSGAANSAAPVIVASSTEPDTEDSASNILVAYFSLAGEQYGVGVIEEGNTSIIARMIAEQIGADLFEIEASTPYPETHSELLDVSRREMTDNARPEIAGTVENMDDYDTVFIGYPNWWSDMPMIVYNFIESYDFSGKTVVPFGTHGGSGLSGTESTIADMTGATMVDGFAISGETAQNDRETSLERVSAWLREAGYIE